MTICEHCGSTNLDLIDSSKLSNGSRRRRYECRTCGKRMTIWIGERPKPTGHRRPGLNVGRVQLPPLDESQVRTVLLSIRSTSDQAMADQIGRSRELIRQIRSGKLYPDSCPDLPRRNSNLIAPNQKPPPITGPTCLTCTNWRGTRGCGFEFPDAIEEGVGFAAECLLYSAA